MKKYLPLALVILWFVSCSEESAYEEVIFEEQIVDNSEENEGSTSTSNEEAGNT